MSDATGAKRKSFILLGHPVRHSASAPMLTAAFRAAGLPHTYTPIDVDRFEDLAKGVSYVRDGLHHGANIAAPHKRAVLKLADEVHASAAEVVAADVLVTDDRGRIVAYNTEVEAIAGEVAELTTGRSRAAILGAGAAGTAAIAACKKLGFAIVGVTTASWSDTEATVDRESAKRTRRLGGLASVWPSNEEPASGTKLSMVMRLQWAELAQQAEIVIQATSAGAMGAASGDPVAAVVPFAKMSKSCVALDLIYRPPRTPFLIGAEEAGLRAVPGVGVAVRQAEATYRLWVGADPPPGVMRRAAEVVVGIATPS